MQIVFTQLMAADIFIMRIIIGCEGVKKIAKNFLKISHFLTIFGALFKLCNFKNEDINSSKIVHFDINLIHTWPYIIIEILLLAIHFK